jgi:hypothetical protein
MSVTKAKKRPKKGTRGSVAYSWPYWNHAMHSQFPLPLTPFEYYYWCDDRPDYPTTFPVELTFSGKLEPEPFSRALATVVARHPLLTALVRREGRSAPLWVEGDDQPPTVDWAGGDIPISHPQGEQIDLSRAPGLRVWVRQTEPTTRVLLQFHHVCCDGLGSLRVIEELLLAYHEHVAGRNPASVLTPLEPQRLRGRGDFGEGGPGRPSLRDLWVGARGWARLLTQSPAPLAVPAAEGPDESRLPFLGFLVHACDAATTRRLRVVASSLGGTLNDLLLRDLFQVLLQWNTRYDGPGNPWFRINMPATLRTREDALAPVANALGFTFLTRRARDCSRRCELFESIRRETETIRQFRLGLYFLGGLAMAMRLPGAIPWVLRRNRSFATIVLSNLGKVLRRTDLPRRDGRLICGEAMLQRITGVPPIRPWTRAAIAVLSYGDETTVNLRCDPHVFSAAQARRFLAEYVAELDHTAQSR